MLIFYDFEVFKYDWLVVFIFQNGEKLVIKNDPKRLLEFYEEHKKCVFVGYNSRFYDQYIFKGIIMNFDPYAISQYIIDGGDGWKFSNTFTYVQLYNYDVMTTLHSLKELEGFMGNSIKESEISFDIDRKLTDAELDEVISYCTHDVEQTIEVFKERNNEFLSHIALLKTFKLPLKYISKTKSQLASIILEATKVTRDDEFNLVFPNTLELNKYEDVKYWYLDEQNHYTQTEKKKSERIIASVPHVFGWGGIHGGLENVIIDGNIIILDVASLYPSLMIEYDYLSRNVMQPEKYKEIRDERLKLKAQKNPRNNVLKLILNSTYGAMKHEHNNLYDPLQANNVCVAGQLLLLDLIEKLEPYIQLINTNTDGLIMKVKTKNIPVVKEIAAKWEQRTRLTLEWDQACRIIQKDVNNYILVYSDGKYKSKGAWVKKLSCLDNDLPIINQSILNYFLRGIKPEKTIGQCDVLSMYQKITKASSKYLYVLYGDEILKEKCLRVFAGIDDMPGVFKVKQMGKRKQTAKMPNTPDHCFIDNKNVKNKTVPDWLNKQWYIDVANERIKDFRGV